MIYIFSHYPNFIHFKTINNAMIGRHPSKKSKLSPSDIMLFKYELIKWVNVEHLFSCNKKILRSKRRHLTFNHLKEIIIIQYNTRFE